MGFFKDLFKKENTKDNPYMGLRRQALEVKVKDLGIELDAEDQVYGAVIDMHMGNGIVTLACFFDGTTSLYYDNGGGMIGLGQKHESIAHATKSFLFSVGQVIGELSVSEEYELPQIGYHNIFLLANDKVYNTQIEIEKIESSNKEIKFLFSLYNMVISEIGQKS